MPSHDRYKGVLSITPTPFHKDGSLDLESIDTLVEFYVEKGVNGLTILGVMGEAHKLLPAERAQVTQAYVEAVDGRMPVLVGTTHAGTNPAVALARQAEEQGAAGIMVAPPPVVGSQSDELVFEHYNTISNAISIPIFVQDYPPTSGVTLTPELIGRMADKIEQVKYLKLEDYPSPAKTGKVKALSGDKLTILGGLGGIFFFEELEHGAEGTMTGFAYPEILVDIYESPCSRGCRKNRLTNFLPISSPYTIRISTRGSRWPFARRFFADAASSRLPPHAGTIHIT